MLSVKPNQVAGARRVAGRRFAPTADRRARIVPRFKDDDVLAVEAPGLCTEFVLKKQCKYGDTWGICGSAPELGAWDQKRSVPLKWSPGDIWTAQVNLPRGEHVEFRFVLLDDASKSFKAWVNDVCGPQNIALDVLPGQHVNTGSCTAKVQAADGTTKSSAVPPQPAVGFPYGGPGGTTVTTTELPHAMHTHDEGSQNPKNRSTVVGRAKAATDKLKALVHTVSDTVSATLGHGSSTGPDTIMVMDNDMADPANQMVMSPEQMKHAYVTHHIVHDSVTTDNLIARDEGAPAGSSVDVTQLPYLDHSSLKYRQPRTLHGVDEVLRTSTLAPAHDQPASNRRMDSGEIITGERAEELLRGTDARLPPVPSPNPTDIYTTPAVVTTPDVSKVGVAEPGVTDSARPGDDVPAANGVRSDQLGSPRTADVLKDVNSHTVSVEAPLPDQITPMHGPVHTILVVPEVVTHQNFTSSSHLPVADVGHHSTSHFSYDPEVGSSLSATATGVGKSLAATLRKPAQKIIKTVSGGLSALYHGVVDQPLPVYDGVGPEAYEAELQPGDANKVTTGTPQTPGIQPDRSTGTSNPRQPDAPASAPESGSMRPPEGQPATQPGHEGQSTTTTAPSGPTTPPPDDIASAPESGTVR